MTEGRKQQKVETVKNLQKELLAFFEPFSVP